MQQRLPSAPYYVARRHQDLQISSEPSHSLFDNLQGHGLMIHVNQCRLMQDWDPTHSRSFGG